MTTLMTLMTLTTLTAPTAPTTPTVPGLEADPEMQEAAKERRAQMRRRGRSFLSSEGERDLNKAMMKSLQAMTSSQLKSDQREDKKKLMLSRLTPKTGNLSRLLSAKDWRDANPNLPDLTKKILEDCDLNRALGEMKSLSKQWPGKTREKGFLSFLAVGCAADGITKAPGGGCSVSAHLVPRALYFFISRHLQKT